MTGSNSAAGLFGQLASVSRYDLVLAVIPVAFLVALLVGQLAPLSQRTALVAASVVGGLALLDALFVNPPQPPAGQTS